jgi:Fe-S-cluster-containing hydrogenase component 2
MCIMVCPLGGPSLDVTGGKVIRCDLCQGEEEPPCAKMCPTEAIRFVSGDVAGMTLKREAMEKLFSLTKQSLETKYV